MRQWRDMSMAERYEQVYGSPRPVERTSGGGTVALVDAGQCPAVH